MKRLLIVVFSLQLLVVFTNCSKKEKEDKKLLIESVWLINGMKEHADSAWVDLYYNSCLSFIGEDRYVLQTGNSCSIGQVKIEKNNKIKFGATSGMIPGYPYVSTVSASHALFHTINHYEVSERKLVLKGDKSEVISLIRYWAL